MKSDEYSSALMFFILIGFKVVLSHPNIIMVNLRKLDT